MRLWRVAIRRHLFHVKSVPNGCRVTRQFRIEQVFHSFLRINRQEQCRKMRIVKRAISDKTHCVRVSNASINSWMFTNKRFSHFIDSPMALKSNKKCVFIFSIDENNFFLFCGSLVRCHCRLYAHNQNHVYNIRLHQHCAKFS